MIIVFVSIFSSSVLSTINRTEIDAKTTYISEEDPSYNEVPTANFLFAVGVSNINLNSGKKWFDFYIEKIEVNKKKKSIRLNFSKCNKEQWVKLKPSMSKTYDKLNIDSYLCQPQGIALELQGKYSSDIFKYYKIGVRACTPTPQQPCVNKTEMD